MSKFSRTEKKNNIDIWYIVLLIQIYVPIFFSIIVPDPPTILELQAGEDLLSDPPTATITVTWEVRLEIM